MNKKEILIIFPNEWLAYTPTVLNIVAKLKDSFEIKVLAIDDGLYNNNNLVAQEFQFIKVNKIVRQLVKFIDLFSFKLGKFTVRGTKFYQFVKIALIYYNLKKICRDNANSEIIAVDSMGLFIAQKLFKKCHFLSLEPHKDYLFRKSDLSRIESAIAHSEERYDYLFKESSINAFIIPNSPIFENGLEPKQYPSSPCRGIFFGNATQRNGIYYCLDAIRSSEDISITVKGAMSPEVRENIFQNYSDLIDSGQLEIDNTYLQQEEIIEYLSRFWFGFCFYNFGYVDEVTHFNFTSVPSGKMFNYYAAGVPVIGSNILGLKSVRDFDAGILLDKPSPETIFLAIKQILIEHQKYRQNCLKAAEHFDFDKSVNKFKEYLLLK
ncbi:MAG: glycosyltransferase [Cyanobacteria bacterium P01_G01_bin.39]